MTPLRYSFILLTLACSVSVLAGPTEFARGRVLLDTENLVQRASLDQDVYEWVVREDLGDLRVFNGNGEEIPYALRRPAVTSAHTGWQSLPLFQLPVAEALEGAAAVNIELGDGGAVVAVHGSNASVDHSRAFLIDASHYDLPVAEIDVGWQADLENRISRFRVESSDDLDQWSTVLNSTTLAALETNGQRVQVNRIALNGVRSRYLRLTSLAGTEPIPITHIRVRSKHSQAPERHWKTLPASPVEGGYEFDTGGLFATDRVSLTMESASYLIEAQLYSRNRPAGPWQDRGVRNFYRVAVDHEGTAAVTGDPVSYATTRDRYWRAEPTPDPGLALSLRIGWLPDELLFLRQGPAPYTLAYGKADTPGRQWPVQEMLDRLDKDATWDSLPLTGLSEARTLAGEAALVPRPAPLDWQSILLWVVLVAGVGGVGLLAFRLVRGQSR
ncbi:MAG: DUF3999 domain-containing protein [Pseudomonadales bacterium]|nr:DUF3999 domain-containing protein [Pseudomonadales bacterium]